MKATKVIVNRKERNQGMNWIRPVKRLAIYLRDGLACAYCGNTVENGAKLTLDHLTPHSKGGTNSETNLITCCNICNSSRGNRAWRVFAAVVAEYVNHGVKADQIIDFVNSARRRKLDTKAAEELIERRGGFSAALYGGQE